MTVSSSCELQDCAKNKRNENLGYSQTFGWSQMLVNCYFIVNKLSNLCDLAFFWSGVTKPYDGFDFLSICIYEYQGRFFLFGGVDDWSFFILLER